MKSGILFLKRTLLLILCITICFSGCSRQEAEIDPGIGTEKSGTPVEAAEPETDEVPEDSVSPEEIANGEIRYLLNENNLLLPMVPEKENRLYRDGIRYLWTADYAKAGSIFEHLVDQDKSIESLNGLALSQYFVGDYDKAEKSLRRALEDVDKLDQELVLHNNLGVILDGLLEFDEGNEEYIKALEIYNEKNDINVIMEICIKMNQGFNERLRGGVKEAQDMMAQQLETLREIQERDLLLEAYLKKCNTQMNKQRLGSSYYKEETEKIMDIFRSMLGESHPMTMILLRDIAYTNLEEGNVDQALMKFQTVLDNLKERLDEDYKCIADVYINLGLCYGMKSNIEKAMQCYKKAAEIYSKTAAGKLELYYPYNNMAGVYYQQEKNEEAIEYLLKAYQILLFRNISYDDEHLEAVLRSIKIVYKRMGLNEADYDKWLEEQMAQFETEVWPEGPAIEEDAAA